MKQLYTFILILFSFANSFAQAELTLADNLNCGNETYCADLQINATSGNSFDVGTSSFLATYDQTVLQYSSYTPSQFDATTSGCAGIWAAQKTDLDEANGQFGLTVRLLNNAGGCTTVGNTPMVIGTICFDVTIQGSIPNITFDNVNSRINSNSSDDGSAPISIATIDTLNVPNSLACDCSGAGDPCDDLNVFTINDQYDINCNCAGTLADVDLDLIYDGVDNCLDVFYEAENGTLIGAVVDADESQYFGSGFVDFKNKTGDTLSFPIIIDSLGEYDLIFRYANGDSQNETRYLQVVMDTTVLTDTLAFPATGSWSVWSEVSLSDTLTADTHMIYLITTGEHGPNLDRVAVSSCGNCTMAGTSCDDGDPCTDSDTYDVDCNCKGVYSDTDNDGVCDNQDICPAGDDNVDTDADGTPDACDDCDNSLIGTACDDGDPCTINDMYDANCDCSGIFSGNDTDMDGVCDASDACPGFDDNLDEDGDGIPDDCDTCNDLTVGQPCDDGNPCTILDVVTAGCGCGGIPIYLELSHDIDTIKCNGDLASIDITPEHMVGGVYYQWNTGAFEEDLTNLSPGTYIVTATDWRNCAAVDTIIINEPSLIDLGFATVPSNGMNGEIDLIVSGGNAPYTFFWADSSTTQDLSGLASDRYYVTVTDSLACTMTGFADVPLDTMCVDTLLQYEYGEYINLQTLNTNFGSAMDGYIRFGHNDAHSSVTHYYDFPEFGKYEFNIRHAEKSRNRTVNIYLDGVLKHADLLIPLTGSDSVFQQVIFTIDSIPPGVHAIMTERATTSNNYPRLDYLSICKSAIYDCPPLNGMACDDGNPCTINDTLDSNCNCTGTYMDSDNDGVCDTNDLCPGGDDTIDSDGDGVPDTCDDCFAIKYEAEDAIRISLNKKTGGSGWTGTGYADYNSKTGDTLRFLINAALAGNYTFSLKYSINASDRYLDILVNDVLTIDNFYFPNTGSGNTNWQEVSFNADLTEGQNIVELITDGFHGPNIDYLTTCLPNFIHNPIIAKRNSSYEDDMNHWIDFNFVGENSPNIDLSTTEVFCGVQSVHFGGSAAVEKMYADIDFLRIDSVYTLHFYAIGDSARGYIGLPDQVYNGMPFWFDATSGNGEFVHQSVTFTATAPTMRILFEFLPYTNMTLDAFSFDNTHCFIDIAAKVMLGGAFDSNTNLMYDSLRQKNLIPLAEPYTALNNFNHQARGGGEMIKASILDTIGNNAIVDWVMLELRDKNKPSKSIASKSALIQRDGDIVGLDGASVIEFRTAYTGDYYVAVRHRNHAGVMTASPVTLGNNLTTIDFTTSATPTFGSNSQINVSGTTMMWSGDASGDGLVKYNGWANDRVGILSELGYINPDSVITNKYSSNDINMDGFVKYNGVANDREIILNHIGLTSLNNFQSGNIPGIGLPAPAQNMEIRAYNSGEDNQIAIQMRCTTAPCPTNVDEISDLVFGLKWSSNSGIELSTPTNTYAIAKSDGVILNSGFEYQAYGMNQLTDFPENWMLNEWTTITTLTVENLDKAAALVEICEPDFQIMTHPNIHINSGATGTDFTPIIANSVDDIANIDDDFVDNDGDNVPNSKDCAPDDPNANHIAINDNPLTSGTFKNYNEIESAAVVDNSAEVIFKATQSIKLLPDFKVTGSSQFQAQITDICNPIDASAVSVDVSCFGDEDGTAAASAIDGDGNYSYSWNTGGTSANINSLPIGAYFVTVTDGYGRTDTASVNINYDSTDTDNDQITDGCDCDPNDASDSLTVINDSPLFDSTYTAPNKLTSASIIETDTATTFKATRNIILKPGFQAKSGSHLIALIEDVCVPPANPIWEDEEDEFEETDPEALNEERDELNLTNDYSIAFIPNPTTGHFSIDSKETVQGYGIYDLLGKQMFSGIGQEVDISKMAAGTYLVRVFFDKKIVVGLVVKQ